MYGRYPDPPHKANFVDSVKSHKRPNADVEEGHRSGSHSFPRHYHDRRIADAPTVPKSQAGDLSPALLADQELLCQGDQTADGLDGPRKASQHDPLLHVPMRKVDTDIRHDRRALTDDEEFLKLVEAARKSAKSVEGMTGPERSFLYTMARMTGLRRSELASLTAPLRVGVWYTHVDRSAQVRAVRAMRSPLRKDPAS